MDPDGLQELLKSDMFGSTTEQAKELIEAERTGCASDLDLGVGPVCSGCKEMIPPWDKPLRCSVCKAMIYCSKECNTKDWYHGTAIKGGTHKQLCPGFKKYMLQSQATQTILKQFPWGRLETDGTFSEDIARGRFDVLGGSDYGFWSHRGGFVPHDRDLVEMDKIHEDSSFSRLARQLLQKFNHIAGKDLLRDEHLSDEEGWRLPAHLILHRDFASPSKRPVLVTDDARKIDSWDSWHEWRQLSKESPVALLMTYPLSTYWLITDVLGLTRPSSGKPNKRIPLHIHLLGAEVELNFLPLFSELALLLPYHDIKLVVFGSSVAKLVSIAKESHPESLAGISSPSTPIFTYNAPKECGNGRVTVYLHGASPFWTQDMLSATGGYGRPDALIGLNAGIRGYPEWVPVLQAAHRETIPFGITDYTEFDLDVLRDQFPRIVAVQSSGVRLMRQWDYVHAMNPFQRPGQRAIPSSRLPNLVNGFTMVMWKRIN